MLHITALYAGLLGLLSIVLAVQTGQIRGSTGITLGDGGNDELILAMRRHANFVEFVPIALILIGLLELNGVSGTLVPNNTSPSAVADRCLNIRWTVRQSLWGRNI